MASGEGVGVAMTPASSAAKDDTPTDPQAFPSTPIRRGHARHDSEQRSPIGGSGTQDGEFIAEDSPTMFLGTREALRGEVLVSEIADTLQLTNYRIIMRQKNEWCMRHGDYMIDAWIKDITSVEIVKERFNPILLSIGIVLILGGVVNYEELGLHLSSDYQLGVNIAPIGFYLIGLAVLIAGQFLRRTCLSIGVIGQTNNHSFQASLKNQADTFLINPLADQIRRIQAPYSTLLYEHNMERAEQ
eukprot:TRINITY_DN16175_c0_g1_i1.p1 TRINITY_DN16175_c0_g1~~TRINITY_DN16175_c0_g1_i1.p1  ORF type:complete len:244 (-),score=60.10 TRINITY_DN16175_c0_g1_i1:544-1275(-)